MCGIVGYIGSENGIDFLIDGLSNLEYRGYDSCGIAAINNEETKVIKTVGRIAKLKDEIPEDFSINIGIGHTRWATHGKVNTTNSHPHQSFNKRFTLVHNGVIENYEDLKKKYFSNVDFISQTDTEVIVQLVEYFYKESQDTETAFFKTLEVLKGSYALCLIDNEDKNELFVAKNKSPLMIGKGKDANYIGSDALAMIKYTNTFYEINDEEVAIITKDKITIKNKNKEIIERKAIISNIKADEIEKGIYPQYMLKEINEQAAVLRKIISTYFTEDEINISEELLMNLKNSDRIYLVACGTSYNASLIGKNFFEKWLNIPAEVHLASEFAYNMPVLTKNPFFIFLSQSGETADLRAVLTRLKKEAKAYKNLVLTNVSSSTLARECDYNLSLNAGPEIAVASTKAYTAQIAVLALLTYKLGQALNINFDFDLKYELSLVANAMEVVLNDAENIKNIAAKLFTEKNAFYIGRAIDYYSSLEAALKLKEITYIQTEGFAGGELKHGSIALIEKNTPVVALITNSSLELNTRSNVSEVASRGAKTFVIALEKIAREGEYNLPNVLEDLAPMLSIIVCQLFSYYTALAKNLDVDKPRNLAKAVTVE